MKRENWRRVTSPSERVLESYKKLFLRNQSKWMRRSKLEQKHLGESFKHSGKDYVLIGTVDIHNNMIVKDSEGNYYFVHSDVIDSILL